MPFLKLWVHVVFATKQREPLLRQAIRPLIFGHIKQNAADKKIHIDQINGYTDHVHILLSLSATQTIAGVVQAIKGESANWINKETLIEGPFSWQGDYFAVSVSESGVDAVRTYIRNQEAHHAKKSFADEVEEFMTRYGFQHQP